MVDMGWSIVLKEERKHWETWEILCTKELRQCQYYITCQVAGDDPIIDMLVKYFKTGGILQFKMDGEQQPSSALTTFGTNH